MGEFVGREWGSVGGMIGGGETEKKVGILGDGEQRTVVIHEEGKREKMEGLLVMRMREDG